LVNPPSLLTLPPLAPSAETLAERLALPVPSRLEVALRLALPPLAEST